MATKRDGTQFIVHLQGITLPPDAEAKIATEVRAAAIRELARLDLAADVGFRIPSKDWIGIWVERMRPIAVPAVGPMR